MQQTSEMISANPSHSVVQVNLLAQCIDACMICSQVNSACADACLGEADPKELAFCIRLNLDCAEICTSTERIVSRQHKPEREMLRKLLDLCIHACQICAVECEAHQRKHEHCRVCAEQCRRTEKICQEFLDQIGVVGQQARPS